MSRRHKNSMEKQGRAPAAFSAGRYSGAEQSGTVEQNGGNGDFVNAIRNLDVHAAKKKALVGVSGADTPGSEAAGLNGAGKKMPPKAQGTQRNILSTTEDGLNEFFTIMEGVTPLSGARQRGSRPAGTWDALSLNLSPVERKLAERKVSGRERSRRAVERARTMAETSQNGAGATDEENFFAAMQGVDRLQGKGRDMQPLVEQKPRVAAVDEDPLRDFLEGKIEFSLEFTEEFIEGHVLGLDPMTVGKLRAGQFSPEAHLDLHGLTAEAARDELLAFFRAAYYKGQRTVLLVPGRGLNSPNGVGVLRSRVQDWLTQDPLKRIVLAFCTARPQDGGAGAVYVLLRKFKKSGGKIRWDRAPDV